MRSNFVEKSKIRELFSSSLSKMYRQEIPAYGKLIELVERVNLETLDITPLLKAKLIKEGNFERISDERHGAIRLGTAFELSMIRRLFYLMGMYPVGYYDLSVAGIPVHSTAFRPIKFDELKKNPFRVFTSLLRLELIDDDKLREKAKIILASRSIFSKNLSELIIHCEKEGGIRENQVDEFVEEATNIFRWHETAIVDLETYNNLHQKHRLIADVVSFRGPHLNHLTPRTLDIEKVQRLMRENGIEPKVIIEGPPQRNCPILLRQTSFKAISETIVFKAKHEQKIGQQIGKHMARFGEIEQRGCALTPKGRELYDRLLSEVRTKAKPSLDGSNAVQYDDALKENFKSFPDTETELREQKLSYFYYKKAPDIKNVSKNYSTQELIKAGEVIAQPIIYEDFLHS